jgi:Skp family chaperone for outer membrane proteins
MKVTLIAVLAVTALAAGFLGGWLREAVSHPEAVAAQGPGNTKPIRIAVVDLERAGRESAIFNERRQQWDRMTGDFDKANQKIEDDIRRLEIELLRARREGLREDMESLRLEITSLEETLELRKRLQHETLASLLRKYQNEVVEKVMEEIRAYTEREQFHLVLQDYTTADSDDADFFAGGSVAQTYLSKPVLHAPGMRAGENPYVVDITQTIIQRMRVR